MFQKICLKNFSFINAIGMTDRGKYYSNRYELGINVNNCSQDDLQDVEDFIFRALGITWEESASYYGCNIHLNHYWKSRKPLRKDIKDFKKYHDFDFLFIREEKDRI